MRIAASIGLAALLAAAALLGAAGRAQAQAPYDIHVMEPLTGGGAFLGKGQQQVLSLLAGAVNKNGGIDGRPVNLVFHDDQTSPQTAVQLLNDILASHPAVVLGSALVGMCNAMAPIMRDGPVLYCLSPGHHPVPGSYDFTSGATTEDSLRALVTYFRLKGWKRIAMITSTDATGQEVDGSIDTVMALPENRDVTTVEHNHFNPTDVSVVAQIERIKAARPDVVIAWTTGSPIATIFKAAVQSGLDVPIATTAGNYVYAQMKQFGAFLPKDLYIASSAFTPHDGVYRLDSRVEAVQHDFYKIIAAGGVLPDNMAGTSWDAAAIVIDGLKKLGAGATAAQLRDYIAKLTDYPGINGMYDFTKSPVRGLDQSGVVVVKWNAATERFAWASAPGGELLPR